ERTVEVNAQFLRRPREERAAAVEEYHQGVSAFAIKKFRIHIKRKAVAGFVREAGRQVNGFSEPEILEAFLIVISAIHTEQGCFVLVQRGVDVRCNTVQTE